MNIKYIIKYFYYTFVIMPDKTSQTDKKDYEQIKPKKKPGPKKIIKPKIKITDNEPIIIKREPKAREKPIFILEFDDN